MEYTSGRIGRVFTVRFDHGEDIIEGINAVCLKENVRSGWFFLFGAVARGGIVLGPEEENIPPTPVRVEFEGPYEILGTGSIASDEGEVSIHLHSSLGSRDGVITGCIREKGEVFVVVECLILELEGILMERKLNPTCGLKLLDFSRSG
jgi:hypothetical protein